MKPEQVVVTPGSKPLLFALFNVLDGDVLLPRPSWPQVMHTGKQLFWVEADRGDRHTYRFECDVAAGLFQYVPWANHD